MYPIPIDSNKKEVFSLVSDFIRKHSLTIESIDAARPWGGFFVIKEENIEEFVKIFFPTIEKSKIDFKQKMQPKILIIAPQKRISWQYHFRRSELWNVIGGKVGVMLSMSDEEGQVKEHEKGSVIEIGRMTRHRLCGLDQWGVVAEIWLHTDSKHPSSEDDIVRLADDFGRNSP